MPRGVWTKSLIPDILKWMDRPGGELSYEATQVLTGHGQFQTYMVRIGKAGSDTCVLCDTGTTDDVEHTVLHCTALQEARDESPAHIRRFKVAELVDSMLGTVTAWREGIGHLNRIMRAKKRLEDARRQALVSQRALPARQDGTEGGESGGLTALSPSQLPPVLAHSPTVRGERHGLATGMPQLSSLYTPCRQTRRV